MDDLLALEALMPVDTTCEGASPNASSSDSTQVAAGASPIVAAGVLPNASWGASPIDKVSAVPNVAAGASPGASSGVAPKEESPSRRMRTTIVKKEEPNDGDADDREEESPSKRRRTTSAPTCNEHVECRGCARSYSDGLDWFEKDKGMLWAHKGARGRWCKDCHTCWRTVYSDVHPLPLFGGMVEGGTELPRMGGASGGLPFADMGCV